MFQASFIGAMYVRPDPTRHRSRRRSAPVPVVDLVIFITGLIAAALAGVIAYRIVGPYGDGPLNAGIYRMTDPETGKALLYRRVTGPNGKEVRYVVDDATRHLQEVQFTLDVKGRPEQFSLRFSNGTLAGIDRDRDGDGRVDVRDYYDDPSGLMKTGFSLTNDGVIDAWAYRDRKGTLRRIEVSRSRDGKVDRWEYYENGQLARAEEDDDHDGRVDRWLTYDAGILTGEAVDRNRDGKPDTPVALPAAQP